VSLFVALLTFAGGLFIIVKGSGYIVNASVKLQGITGMGEIAVGAVFVSVATTLPEVFVSIIAVIGGDDEIAVGNAVGSMIFNMAVVVAVYLLARPQVVERKQMWWKSIFLFFVLFAVILFSLNGRIGLAEGLCLFGFFVLFVLLNIRENFPRHPHTTPVEGAPSLPLSTNKAKSIPQVVGLFILGQVMLIMGAWLLVSNGEKIADMMHISESIVAIIFIAVGTGLPELSTAITSIRKKHNGIALGNILGSCVLNCTLLLGSCGIIASLGSGLPISNGILYLSLPVMFVASLVAIVPIITTQKTRRVFGVVLIALYAAYLLLLCF
jgi:cation:H+ antiporter